MKYHGGNKEELGRILFAGALVLSIISYLRIRFSLDLIISKRMLPIITSMWIVFYMVNKQLSVYLLYPKIIGNPILTTDAMVVYLVNMG